jgi:hypothetical protein
VTTDAYREETAIARWLVRFAGRKPTTAAREASSLSGDARRRFFLELQRRGCIEEVAGGTWQPVNQWRLEQ